MSGSRKIRPTFAACGVHRIASAVLLFWLMIPACATAAAMVVFDPTNWAENVAQLKQIEQSLATARAHHEASLRGHGQHQIDQRGYRGQRSLRSSPATIDEDAGISERCSASSAPSVDLRQYCAHWVRAQNLRYNAIVTLQAQHQQREEDWLALLREREQLAADQSGLLQSHLSRMAAFQAQLQIDLGFVSSLLANHDRYVDALHGRYVQAVRDYLNGSHTANPAQRLAQQQLLRAALLVAGSRRR
jgi:conjugal transfer/entry exclusion protein